MRREYVDTPRGQVHLRRAGDGGRAVLLLHQTAASGAMFERFAAELLALAPGLQLIAPDTAGFGMSFAPQTAYDLDDWAADVSAVMDGLQIECSDVLGHHTGAAIATVLAARAPERVRSLAMIGSVALPAGERALWSASVSGMRIDEAGSHLAIAWTQVATIDGDPNAFPPDLALRHREVVDKLHAGERWHEAYLAVFGTDVAAVLATTTAPALLLCGTADVLHEYVSTAREARPDMQYVELDSGAYVLDQEPRLVAAPYAGFLDSIRHGAHS